MTKEEKVVIKQVASPIGRNSNQRATLIGLGLNKINRSIILPFNSSIEGMIKKVSHLVEYKII